jgi:hypothetical protein
MAVVAITATNATMSAYSTIVAPLSRLARRRSEEKIMLTSSGLFSSLPWVVLPLWRGRESPHYGASVATVRRPPIDVTDVA